VKFFQLISYLKTTGSLNLKQRGQVFLICCRKNGQK